MKITLLEIHDFKRLSDVTIEPGERNLILVGGNNTQGKSSLLGAMGAALGGKREIPDDPIRHGAKKASIRVVFDDGDLIVRRKFTAKGSTLEVTGADGKIAAPQKMLDQLVGSRFIDPMKFSRLSGIEMRKTLLGCVDLGLDLDENMADEKKAYDERRDLNREIKKLEAKVEDRTFESIPEEKDANALIQKIDDLNNEAQASKDAVSKIAAAERTVNDAEQRVAIAQSAFIAARDEVKAAKAELADDLPRIKTKIAKLREQAAIDVSGDLSAAKEELAHCSEHNGNVAKLRAERDQFEEIEKELRETQELADDLTEVVDRAKADRTDALAQAEMPIPGLSFGDDGLILNDAPFNQASGAEKLRASIAIAWALKPDLCDIWVEDGALLDENSLAIVREFAEENDLRIWLERVGEGDEEAIIMVDGAVKS